MSTTLHKKFSFSSSFERGGKIYAHNYVLEVVTDVLSEEMEASFEAKILERLIKKLDSRDLGLHVDFLKRSDFTETALLKAMCEVISKEIAEVPVKAMALERDKNTRVCLEL